MDIVIKGRMKAWIGDNCEILEPGDSIYYNSTKPHALAAMDGEDVEIYAIVMHAEEGFAPGEYLNDADSDKAREAQPSTAVYKKYVYTEKDEKGRLKKISFMHENEFNFAFDCVDVLAKKCPDKVCYGLRFQRQKGKALYLCRHKQILVYDGKLL